jgi:hypothetical protein
MAPAAGPRQIFPGFPILPNGHLMVDG